MGTLKSFFAGATTSSIALLAIQQRVKSNYTDIENNMESARTALSVRMQEKEIEQPISRPLTTLWNNGMDKLANFLTHLN